MNSLLLSIRALYDDMGRAEKKIADRILKCPQDIIRLSISQLSSECGCGDATVVRFSRRLGLEGYQGLKIALAQETSNYPVGSVAVSDSDGCFEIFNKRVGDITLALESTKAALDRDELEKAAKAVMSANRIILLGLGNSASVAIDAQHKFARAGLNAVAYSDNHMQVIVTAHLHEGDVAIGISHSGSSMDVVDALKQAKKNNATTVCITNKGVSPITKHSDIILYTDAEETKYTILALSSRIAQLAIIDSIYTYIVINSGSEVQNAIRKTEQALQGKKY